MKNFFTKLFSKKQERFSQLLIQKSQHLAVFMKAHSGLLNVMEMIKKELEGSAAKKIALDLQIKAVQAAHVVEDEAIAFLQKEHANTLETAKSLAAILKIETPGGPKPPESVL